ncbi:MAG: MFS transporter [Chloroflexota bacterium]
MLRRNLSLDMTAAVGVGITTAVMGTLLPSVARREGLDPLGLAVLAASPFLANLLGAFAGRVGPRNPVQFGLMRAAGALCLVIMFFLPVPQLLAFVALGYWLASAFGVPMQHRLWGAMYPNRERGRLIGVVATGRTGAAAVAALVGGIVADRIGGPGAIAIAGAIGAMLALASTGIRTQLPAAGATYSFRETWQAYQSVPALKRVGWAQVFYGGGLIAAGPLYALVQVDRLQLSLGEVGTIGMVTAIAATGSCFFWGWVSDRIGGLSSIQIGTVLGAVSIAFYAMAPSIAFVWVAAALVGLANSATEMGWPNMLAEHSSLADRAKVAAGLNALTGARGLIAPFLGSLLVQAGILSVTAALALCCVATAIGALLYLGMTPRGEPRAWFVRADSTAHQGLRRARALVPSLGFPGFRG